MTGGVCETPTWLTMADPAPASAVLRRTDATPIARLQPDLDDMASRVVDGVVTVTWPYSIVTKSIAFILAEHDFRQRRVKGQLRVELHGPAAQALVKSGIGGGDEARLSLRGAEWEKHQAPTPLRGDTLEWQLKFSNHLLLEVRKAQGQGTDLIQVQAPEHPEVQPEPSSPLAKGPVSSPPQAPSKALDTVATPPRSLPAKRPASSMLAADEFASPAFLKRARVSYGSLFEGGLDDMLDQGKEVKDKSKRRSRFSMENVTWQYTSRSPTPEVEDLSDHKAGVEQEPAQGQEAPASASNPKASQTRPSMVDEACQTQEEYFSPPHVDVQALTGSRVPPTSQSVAAPGLLGQYQGYTGFQTPSRTLFDRRPGRGYPPTSEGTEMAYSNVYPHSQEPGIEAQQHVDSAITPVAPMVAEGASPANLVQGLSESGYPPGAYEASHLDATTMSIDPNLRFPAPVPDPDHIYFDAPPDQVEWHADPLVAENQWAPIQHNDQPMVTGIGSSPASIRPESISSGSSAGDESEPDPSGSEEVSPAEYAEDLVEANAAGSNGVDPRYDDARDIPGEDYDLRNYDSARDDDEEAEPEEEAESDGSNVEKQAIDLFGDDEEAESEEGDESDGGDVEQEAIDISEDDEENIPQELTQHHAEMNNGLQRLQRDDDPDDDTGYLSSYQEDSIEDEAGHETGSEQDDDEAESYDEESEEGSDGHSEDEEDDEKGPRDFPGASDPSPRPAAPRAPVFIDLLSDSEEEEERPSIQPRQFDKPSPPISDLVSPSKLDGGAHRQAPSTPDGGASLQAQDDAGPISNGSASSRSLDVHEHASSAQEAAAESRAEWAVEMELESSQPERTTITESAQHLQASTSDGTSLRDLKVEEQRQHAESGRDEPVDAGAPEFTTNDDAGTALSNPMSVDGGPHNEAPGDQPQITEPQMIEPPSDQAPITEIPSSDPPADEVVDDRTLVLETSSIEVQKNTLTSSDSPPPMDGLETSVLSQPSESKALEEVSSEHREATTAAFETQPRVVEQEDHIATASLDSPMEDVLLDRVSEHHEFKSPTGADAVAVLSQVQGVESESAISAFQRKASEDAAEAEGPKTAPGVAAQLLTPNETQLKDDTAVLDHADDETLRATRSEVDTTMLVHAQNETPGEDEADLAAQTQIITEYQEYRGPAMQNTTRVDSSTTHDEMDSVMEEPELLITVTSLRSRAHLRARSDDVDSRDPSVLLAKAPAPEPSGPAPGTEPKSPRRLRVASDRNHTADPSLSLAKATSEGAAHSEVVASSTTSRAASGTADDSATAVPVLVASSPSAKGKRRQATPEVTRELRSKPQVGRRSTPDTVAETILKSPSVAESVEDDGAAAMKRSLQKTLRTALPDFVPLRTLRSSLNKTVDILAVSTLTPAQPHRPKNGPRDYMLELIFTDPSTAPTSVAVAHLFRPHQASLPVVKAGDVILLRRVQVVSVKGRGFGARAGDSSAWAVFEKDDEEMLPQIKGPPVEVTEAEVEYAQGLKRWWAMLGEGAMAKVDKATQKTSLVGKGDAR